uniref:Transposase n=1 Tax=Haemonchus placei TaxID=6290 RepID=A0A0N4VTX6_HAEPC
LSVTALCGRYVDASPFHVLGRNPRWSARRRVDRGVIEDGVIAPCRKISRRSDLAECLSLATIRLIERRR